MPQVWIDNPEPPEWAESPVRHVGSGHEWQRLKTADDDNQPQATFVLWACPCGATQLTEHPINDPAEPVKETTDYVIPEAALKGLVPR